MKCLVNEEGAVRDLPLNMEPRAPSFENMLVPVPVVFSPAAGCISTRISNQLVQKRSQSGLQSALPTHECRCSFHFLSGLS